MRAVVVLGEVGGAGLDHRLADLVDGVEFGDGLGIAGGDLVHRRQEGLGRRRSRAPVPSAVVSPIWRMPSA